MTKAKTFLLILLLAPLLGAIYGAAHNQITYSISEEYFTKFKFDLFGFEAWNSGTNIGTWKAPEIILESPRFGAALVGALSTWWVGMIIGVILGFIGLKNKNEKQILKTTTKAFFMTITIAIFFGFLGWGLAQAFLVDAQVNWYLPDNVLNRANFITAGSIHNASYFGGLIGLIVASIYSIKQNKKSY